MPDTSVTNKDPTTDLMRHYANILANFQDRMSLGKAEQLYGMTHGELKAAIDSGKCRAYKVGSRYKICHQFVAEYVERYCTFQREPLPS